MKIGILGTGNIGKTLTRRLSAAGHEVKAANSRGPETIEADVLASGGRAVTAAEAVVDVDAMIPSVTVLPEDRTSATASRLNSSEYRLLRLLLLPTWHYFL
ncbi:NAD(P)-binding domain-containing protein [Streptomyces sp. ALI-76-A]|jgi:predicted dinucleotide-binding enzyme|uniref:NAD(P)-binding domain-containing protein n=1 Tax=Streptomyces sp. ALI-76-A TaxID=3025736 RepID=UPI00256EFB8C|nr:NAD(P)-binding domain-containing protein [Streptomyces sp. ALI-76-A]MDL5206092.1 NAD(P)-binding domain-containing protein [Streptomyces sp. ALI-76-A]